LFHGPLGKCQVPISLGWLLNMPKIFDNIRLELLPELKAALSAATRADFCVGYLHLRGWRLLDEAIESWQGTDDNCCRVLVGMQRPADGWLTRHGGEETAQIDNQSAARLKRELAEEFKQQLVRSAPNNDDEAGLRRLAQQLRARKVRIKLHARHPLHAKLYLLFRSDALRQRLAFVGSSNLTVSGLRHQGELNIDVADDDACAGLAEWFDARWQDRFCIDISDELASIIQESWARTDVIPPHHIYLKMVYHLSREARAGIRDFRVPRELQGILFDYQIAAVKIAAHHVLKRQGVMLGDVVGLGKTMMATALARILEEDHDLETLIICPPRLKTMWDDYRERFRLRGMVLSSGKIVEALPDLRRYRVVIVDESHNLRSRDGVRYRALLDYVQRNDCRVVLLSATPYNASYRDLSTQLRLFVPEDKNLGVRPERLLRELGETEFARQHQCSPQSLAAFEKSPYADDWRELMRLYLVRRTRSFIKTHYAAFDEARGRHYLPLANGSRSYFPSRTPKTAKFSCSTNSPSDLYGRMMAPEVFDAISGLHLPRYGLGNYVISTTPQAVSPGDARILGDLSRAGRRLIGFYKTHLLKRLESSGAAFLLSIHRHILRNDVLLYALENGFDIPIGAQDAPFAVTPREWDEADGSSEQEEDGATSDSPSQQEGQDARRMYETYQGQHGSRFSWISSRYFTDELREHLAQDNSRLRNMLERGRDWKPELDPKYQRLRHLIAVDHPQDKILVFTQFADTAEYLVGALRANGLCQVELATGASADPTDLAWRFSPRSNERAEPSPEKSIRVLVATDVLSEGQNLQDCSIVVNFDLPWAIIKLIQRAGRVDRIGQLADEICCYTFLPAEGVEGLLRLRSRVQARLRENAEVVGTDESFFEDQSPEEQLKDLYNERSGVLDDAENNEIDLASHALQLWNSAIAKDATLAHKIAALPDVTFTCRESGQGAQGRDGALVYIQQGEDYDALLWVDPSGRVVTESQLEILRAAECDATTPSLVRAEWHHDAVAKALRQIRDSGRWTGGRLGRASGARFRTYERLKAYLEGTGRANPLFDVLSRAMYAVHERPLREGAKDLLNRQLKLDVPDSVLAPLIASLHQEGRLCIDATRDESAEPRIVCSMGLRAHGVVGG
jgi:superfamily II DNA or RNA helicase